MRIDRKLVKAAIFAIGTAGLTACGSVDNSASETKIVGGTNVPNDLADHRRWSTVALTTDFSRDGQPSTLDQNHSFCSGTIIGPRAIMTAAHCIQAFDANTRRKLPDLILPNGTDFMISFDTNVAPGGRLVRAAKAIPHPDWDPNQTLSPQPTAAPNDIGLIILESDIPDGARIAELGLESDTVSGNIQLVGYGVSRSRNTNDTGVLRQVEVPVNGVETGTKRFQVGAFGRGACAGDSGGPAYMKKGDRYVVIGATSTGAEFAGMCLGLMNFYTDARYYSQWLAETIAAN